MLCNSFLGIYDLVCSERQFRIFVVQFRVFRGVAPKDRRAEKVETNLSPLQDDIFEFRFFVLTRGFGQSPYDSKNAKQRKNWKVAKQKAKQNKTRATHQHHPCRSKRCNGFISSLSFSLPHCFYCNHCHRTLSKRK